MIEPRRSSWQIFTVGAVDEACLARSLGIPGDALPVEAQKELARIVSKHRRQARIDELDKVQGEVIAMAESVREWLDVMPAKIKKLADSAIERIRLAREQAEKDS